MKNQSACERALALLNETIEVLQRIETAPDSPVDTFVPAKTRRTMRRGAELLRRGEAQPRYKNLFTAEQLADIYEDTARRDEIRQQVREEFFRIGRELGRTIAEDPEGTRRIFEAFFLEKQRLANEHGPGSDAARAYRQLERVEQFAKMSTSGKRRQKLSKPPHRPVPAHDKAARIPLIPAQIVDSAPEGEPVISFPAEGEDSGRERILIRIGVGASSWLGSF